MINAVTARNYALAHSAFQRFIPAVVVSGGGGIVGAATVVVSTVAVLRTIPTAQAALANYAIVTGNVSAFDGNGGDYVWDPTGTDLDDGLSFIRPFDFTVGGWRKHI